MWRKLAAITVITLAPGVAAAHPGLAACPRRNRPASLHPLGGIDHILAMIAVGVFAAQLGGRALWLVPAAFVATMAAAGVLGMAGIALPYTEIGIALSVIALGAAVAFRVKVPTTIAMAMVALFAIFHGYAHGAEMPETLSGLGYGLGFVCCNGAAASRRHCRLRAADERQQNGASRSARSRRGRRICRRGVAGERRVAN